MDYSIYRVLSVIRRGGRIEEYPMNVPVTKEHIVKALQQEQKNMCGEYDGIAYLAGEYRYYKYDVSMPLQRKYYEVAPYDVGEEYLALTKTIKILLKKVYNEGKYSNE